LIWIIIAAGIACYISYGIGSVNGGNRGLKTGFLQGREAGIDSFRRLESINNQHVNATAQLKAEIAEIAAKLEGIART
jgi:hypothetical protein